MIHFERYGSIVKAIVKTSIGYSYPFKWDCDSPAYATLLREHLQGKMYRELEQIRREAYDEGWRDKTKRKPKQTWFKGSW